MVKILQARLQQYMNQRLPDAQTGYRKGIGIRDEIANRHWVIGKAREFQKNFYFCFIDCAKLLLFQANCGKFFKIWKYQTTWPVSREIWMQVKKKVLEWDMEQLTGSKFRNEYVKAVYCHLANLTYMQSTSCKMPGWMKLKLESRLPGEISITSNMKMTPNLWQKVKRN